MKKIIISFTLIVLLSGCSAAGTKPAVTNQAQPEPNINIEAQPQAVSLTEFNDKAKEAMPAWFTLWTEVYNGSGGFSLEDFSSGLPIEIEYYKEYDYDETRGNDEPGGFSIVKLNSPDNKYRVLVFYGNDPDSGAAIVDLATKRIKHFTSMQCGTPCIFTDGFWIDNDRFIVAGNTEAYPFGYLETNASGKNYEAPFIYLVDLSQNLLTRYEHRNPVSRERYDDVRAMLVEQQKNKDKLRKIIPLGYFKEPKSETEGIAYLKSENSDLFVYKYINGVKTNTNFSLFKANLQLFDIISGVIAPQGDQIAYYIYDGDNGLFKSLYYTDLKNPSEIVKLFNGSEHHFDLNPNFFFNSTGDKLLYQSFFIDEFSGSVTLTEYDLAAKKANIINSIGFSCDNDANCSGNDDIKGDSIIPLGYAMSDGQEAVFYAVKEDDKYIVYKNDKPFTRFNNAPIEIAPELMGVPRVSRNGDNIYYLMDNKELHLATLGSSLEVKTQAGPHTYDFLLVSSDLPGPHGGINSQYQVSPFSDHVLYVNSSGAEGWLELKLYSLENSEKKLIDSLEFDENNL